MIYLMGCGDSNVFKQYIEVIYDEVDLTIDNISFECLKL